MNKITKITTVCFGLVGSIILCIALIGSIFSIESIKDANLYKIALPFFFAFFMASVFIFTKTNHFYKLARGINALAMSLAVSLVVLDVKDINPNFVFVVISGSLLFYNICDILFRKIKLPQIFIVLPMIIFFIYEIINYSRNNTTSILIGTIGLTILFAWHLLYKSFPIFKEKVTEEVNSK